MIKNPTTDQLLIDQYTKLLQESNFIGLAKLTAEVFNIRYFKFNRKIDIEQILCK
jgi:hypothetical protein